MRRLFLSLPLFLWLVACDQGQWVNSPIEDYSQARDVFWESLYPGAGETLYCGQTFTANDHRGLNIEHVFPMSWVTNALQCGTRQQCRRNSALFNRIEADLHNLYPARTDINAARSSHRFGEISGERRSFGSCDFEVNRRTRVAEPAPDARGRIARAMFYMAFAYRDQGLVIFDRSVKLLQQWHKQFPPDAEERRRNKRIAQLQGNANPFIDEPERLNQLINEGGFKKRLGNHP